MKGMGKKGREEGDLICFLHIHPLSYTLTLYIPKLAGITTHSSCCTHHINKNNFKPTNAHSSPSSSAQTTLLPNGKDRKLKFQ